MGDGRIASRVWGLTVVAMAIGLFVAFGFSLFMKSPGGATAGVLAGRANAELRSVVSAVPGTHLGAVTVLGPFSCTTHSGGGARDDLFANVRLVGTGNGGSEAFQSALRKRGFAVEHHASPNGAVVAATRRGAGRWLLYFHTAKATVDVVIKGECGAV